MKYRVYYQARLINGVVEVEALSEHDAYRQVEGMSVIEAADNARDFRVQVESADRIPGS